MKEFIGRVTKIKQTKNNTFIILKKESEIQIVVKPEKYPRIKEIKVGDIVLCKATDDNNVGKYKVEIPTYLLVDIKIINQRIKEYTLNYSKERLKNYSDAKNKDRNYLLENNYIEVHVPVLTDGETSSKATSFVTEYSKTGKKLFLRKTMDSFMRILSCNDINKIFSFGPCFRNEHVTSKNMPEFEMLSVFTNYMTLKEGIALSTKILKLILGKDIEISEIDNNELINNTENKFWIIKNLNNEVDSYANVAEDGTTNEFKIKFRDRTLIHGVMEIENIKEYKKKINEQGKKKDYGELQMLENALANGAPPCFNMGINILRTLALCNELKIKDYDVFAFSRLNLGKQRGE